MDNNNSYLVPANAKKGTLIFNMFTPFDLTLFGVGTFLSLLLLTIVPSTNTVIILLCCVPVALTGLLVMPIPNYHNVLTALGSIISFYTERRRFIWKGWCFYEQFVSEQQRKK